MTSHPRHGAVTLWRDLTDDTASWEVGEPPAYVPSDYVEMRTYLPAGGQERIEELERQVADLEEAHWPWEWQVATRERERRKAAEARAEEAEAARDQLADYSAENLTRAEAAEQQLARVREYVEQWRGTPRLPRRTADRILAFSPSPTEESDG